MNLLTFLYCPALLCLFFYLSIKKRAEDLNLEMVVCTVCVCLSVCVFKLMCEYLGIKKLEITFFLFVYFVKLILLIKRQNSDLCLHISPRLWAWSVKISDF